MPEPSDVLIVGHVTWDETEFGRVPGGTVCYAARTAAAMGVHARVLAGAGPDADLLALDGHEVHVVRTDRTLTFRNEYDGGRRRQAVLATPGRALSPRDLPRHWPLPAIAVVGPLLDGDVAPEFGSLALQECALIGQGYQREIDESGTVRLLSEPSRLLRRACSPVTSLFLSVEELEGWAAADFERLVAICRRVVITYGDRGMVVHRRDGISAVSAMRVEAVDATGAGDVFATAFILALGAGEREAGLLAAGYAAAAVRTRGAGALPPRSAIEAEIERCQRESRG